jgi:RNA polymerase sigma factor (sigma-70 family)
MSSYQSRLLYMEDKELIEGCRNGHLKAQKLLYDRFSRPMYLICLRFSKNEEDAQDILQDAFIKVFKYIKDFREESTLYYWIKRIVINTAINYQRSQLFLHAANDLKGAEHVSAFEDAVSNYNYEELLKLLQSLPDGCRIIFNLFAIEGFKHKEIAEKLGISEGTSKSQFNRAKTLLKEMIAELEKPYYEESRGI